MGDMADLFDSYEDEWDETEPAERDCNRCGADELHWEEARSRPGNRKIWVLVERDGSVHACPTAAPASADEFPLLSGD